LFTSTDRVTLTSHEHLLQRNVASLSPAVTPTRRSYRYTGWPF